MTSIKYLYNFTFFFFFYCLNCIKNAQNKNIGQM